MYKTKKEVDLHVRSALSKVRNEHERNLRSFTIAKLYYKINEYPSAEQYISAYLTVKDDNDQAHKLLGQCYLRLKKIDKALISFQRSLQLNPKQPDVLAEVCQILINQQPLNANTAKYWCDLAEAEKVHHEAVFSLRLLLMNKENSNQVEEVIQKEITARPNDVSLRVRLIRYYMENNKIVDAFKYIYNLEMTTINNSFICSEWYNTVWLVLSKYEQLSNIKKDWEYWLILLICLERQIYISFTINNSALANGGTTETANLLFNLDQYLYKISQIIDNLNQQKELILRCIAHYTGQMLLHAASLIFKRELIHRKNKWKETIKSALPLLLFAYQCETPNAKEPWMKHSDENGKRLIQLWNREGAFRCVQVGRTLFSCIFDYETNNENSISSQLNLVNNILGNNQNSLWTNSDELISQIKQICSDKTWRHNVFSLLYCNSDQKIKEQTSYLIRNSKLNEPKYELPTYAEIENYEEAAQYLKPESLQHLVYLCLGNNNLAYIKVKSFSGLNFSTQNLSFCGAESLNQLDIDTFLYATTIQAKRMLEVENDTYESFNSDNNRPLGKPRIMPFVNLQVNLCTEEQSAWWLAAYKVYKNLTSDNLSELRATLQYGIEAVRGVNGPKMDIIIVFKLGHIFVARSQDSVKTSEKTSLEARAEIIYKHGLNMLKINNKGVLEPFRKYFKYIKSNCSIVEREISKLAEDAVSWLAGRYFKKAEYEELIDELTGVQLPFASYLQSEAYRRLDEANKTPKKSKRIYLDRATECLNQSLNLLKSTQTDPNHPLNSMVHAELKRLQQATNKFLINDSPNGNNNAHNGSSTYEDAESDYCGGDSLLHNRSRRDNLPVRIGEVENLCRQMFTTLTFVKEELCDTIIPEMRSLKKDIAYFKDKMLNIEDIMRKKTITSNPLSQDDDAANVLDDFYIIEDALQNQMYTNQSHQQQQQQQPTSQLSQQNVNNLYAVAMQQQQQSQQQQQQQQRMQTSNAMQMQQTVNAAAAAVVAAAYNNPLYNPNYSMNYYTPPYLMTPQQAAAGAAVLGNQMGQRNPLSLPYLDSAMNFNMPPSTPLLQPPSLDSNRPANVFGLLAQQTPQQQQSQPLVIVPPPLQASTPIQPPPALPQALQSTIPPLSVPVPSAQVVPIASQTSQMPPSVASSISFSKSINNAPVEKGPPANVVISHSDPLPINNGSLQTSQPMLSVTIPSHHIKQSIVPAVNDSGNVNIPVSTISTLLQGFTGLMSSGNNSSTFANIGTNASTTVSSVLSHTPNAPSKFSISSTVFSSTSSVIVPPVKAVSPETFSFKSQIAQAKQAEQLQQQKQLSTSLSLSQNKTNDSVGSDHNKSEPEVEYDPRPDFQPIIPLPPEIEVTTGEEDEEIMFCARAKLFRHMDKEWKERGIGDIKILKSKLNGSRVLMRRDQTHKICANHKITNDIIITKMKNDARCYMWAANDYADEELKLEKFLIRFKLAEMAKKFYDAFVQAKKEDTDPEIDSSKNGQSLESIQSPKSVANLNFADKKTGTPATKNENIPLPPQGENIFTSKLCGTTQISAATTTTTTTTTAATTISKSLFDSTVFTPADTNSQEKKTQSPFSDFSFNKAATSYAPLLSTSSKQQPFANILSNFAKSNDPLPTSPSSLAPIGSSTFKFVPTSSMGGDSSKMSSTSHNKSGTSDNEEEYVPTAQFKPVIPLPDLVEVLTGEENEIILFEHRGKLLRYDKEAGEWKERGLGNMKILQNKDDFNKVRLVMRREIVHKLCCNQRLYKDTVFKYAKNTETALIWAGQDYSENELQVETLIIRFKTPEICKDFYNAIIKAQSNMSSEAEQENVEAAEKVEKAKQEKEENKIATTATLMEKPKGFGDLFKPKAGSWNCEACYTANTADQLYCMACEAPKDANVPKKESSSLETSFKSPFSFGFSNTTSDLIGTNKVTTAFNFGIKQPPESLPSDGGGGGFVTPASVSTIQKDSSRNEIGFGDAFKPKEGSWSCKGCYVNNDANSNYCKACEGPKDDTIPKKEIQTVQSNILAPSNPSVKFNFGFTATHTSQGDGEVNNSNPFTFNVPTSEQSTTNPFSFKPPTESGNGSFNFTPSVTSSVAPTPLTSSSSFGPSMNISKSTFSFTMPSRPIETSPQIQQQQQQQQQFFPLDKKEFSFVLKPKSPGSKSKSPNKSNSFGDDPTADGGDDGEFHEEENNAYFTPVIPLPEKIEVKTGEEDEDALFCIRSKLFRFIEGEWKERGLGDVKILRHKETKKLRVVMRRDQIFKICLNHVLNEAVVYKRKDDKSWLFAVNDFSENQIEFHQFSIRFKTKEIAEDFMNAVKKALSGDDVKSTVASPKSAQVDAADKTKLAEKLQLPLDFFDESNKNPCQGCVGCDAESFVFPEYKESDKENNPLPLQMPDIKVPEINHSIVMKASALSPLKTSSTSETNASPAVTTTSSSKAPATTFSFQQAIKETIEKDENNKSNSVGYLFGSSSTGNVFGSNSSGKPFEGDKPSIFGGSSSTPLKSDNSTATTIFGSNASPSIFSGLGNKAYGKSIFGTPTKTQEFVEGKSIFGGTSFSTPESKSIFGGTTFAPTETKFIFGENTTASEEKKKTETDPIPKTDLTSSKNIFSGGEGIFSFKQIDKPTLGFAEKPIIFGQTAPKSFTFSSMNVNANPNVTEKQPVAFAAMKNTEGISSFADLANNSGAIDFAALSAKSNASGNANNGESEYNFLTKPIDKDKQKSEPLKFFGLKNNDAFSNFQKTTNEQNKLNSNKTDNSVESKEITEEKSAADNDENYDPYYEPIISLPNEIILATGEEDETKLFGERATLFRYDDSTKEWKERGVGELKILEHNTNKTYRLLMRRDQVHKLVLNHAIGEDFSFDYMTKSPKSFVWAALNYAENAEQAVTEKLAVRFRTIDIAKKFETTLKTCIENVKERSGEDSNSNFT